MKNTIALLSLILYCLGISAWGSEESQILDCFPSPKGDVTMVLFRYGPSDEGGGKFLNVVSRKTGKTIASLGYGDVATGDDEEIYATLSYPEAYWSADGQYFALCGVCLPRDYKFLLFRYHHHQIKQIKIPEFPSDRRYIIAEDNPLNHVTEADLEKLRKKFHVEHTSPLMWKDNRLFVKAAREESFYSMEGDHALEEKINSPFETYRMAVLQLHGGKAQWLRK